MRNKPPNELITYIWKLREEEQMPIHFRRYWLTNNRVRWYVWYGYILIADKVDQQTAHQAIRIAAAVHLSIYGSKTKVA